MNEGTTSRKQRVVLQHNALPDYRQEVLRLLAEQIAGSLSVFVGAESFDHTVQTDFTLNIATRVTNHYLLRRQFLWQRGVVRNAIRADRAIIQLNPRILSSWVILLLRRLLGRPTVLWGHVWSRSGPAARTNALRTAMRSLATTQVVYTYQQRHELLQQSPSMRVVVAPNAIYRADEIDPSSVGRPTDILYAGRLVPAKKPVLLLEAYIAAVEYGLPSEYTLSFFGAGPLRSVMENILAPRGDLRQRVRFRGHVNPYDIHRFYREALVSVSPGYVGLSATQSFSFGVPLIFARDEPHAPEIEAVRPGINAFEVPSDDPKALARVLLEVVQQRTYWTGRRDEIAAECERRYTVERMAAGLSESISQ